MQLEKNDEVPGEPEDGWQSSPQLYNNEILTIALCKYTGHRISDVGHGCEHREVHPAESCVTLYHSAAALQRGEIDYMQFPPDIAIVEIRASNPSDDPIGATHA